MRNKFFWLFVLASVLVIVVISFVSQDGAHYAALGLAPEILPGNGDAPDYYDIEPEYDYEDHYAEPDEVDEAEDAGNEIETNTHSPGSLDTDSDAVMVAGRYAGFLLWGYFHPSAAAPLVVVESSVRDTYTDSLLMAEDIIDFEYRDKAFSLLGDAVLAKAPEAAPYLGYIDESWFAHLIMDHDGLRVLLRPDILPWESCFLTVMMPYEDLGDAFLLGVELGLIEPAHMPMVALTFDDGPSIYTDMILDMLEEVGGRATFCVLGSRIQHRPETLIRIVEMGSEVIGHSWDHSDFTRLGENGISYQITRTSAAIEEVTGQPTPPMFRAPFGAANRRVRDVSRDMGYALLHWSVDPQDWANRDANYIYNNIMNYVTEGSIILLHDIYYTTVEAMRHVIPWLIEEGFQLVTASELIKHHYGEIVPGETYMGYRDSVW